MTDNTNADDTDTDTDAEHNPTPSVCEIKIEDAAFVATVPKDGTDPHESITDAIVRDGPHNTWVQHVDEGFDVAAVDDATNLLVLAAGVDCTVWVQNVPNSLDVDSDDTRLRMYAEQTLAGIDAVASVVRTPVREAYMVERYDSVPTEDGDDD